MSRLMDRKTTKMMKGLGENVFQILCKPFGPGIIPVAAADTYRETEDYYFLSFDADEAARAADERIKIFRAEIVSASTRKPHRLMTVGIPKRQNTCWLTLATRAFSYDGYNLVGAGGKKVAVLVFGYDSVEEVEAAAQRVRACPQFGARMGLFHLSRPDGGERKMRDLKLRFHSE